MKHNKSATKIAIIMSVYKNDYLDHLKEALDSLFNQTYPYIDIYIQQDGPLPQNIENYLNDLYNTKKITYLGKRNENKGLAYSLNELLKIVLKKYDYIARMDADDISLPNRIEKQYSFMKNNLNIDLCGTFIKEFSLENNYKKIIRYPLDHEGCYKLFSSRNPFAHPSIIFRKSFFQKAGFYPTHTNCHEDTILLLSGFLNGCRGANLNKVLLKFRIDKNFFKRRKKYKFSKLKDRLLIIQKLDYNWLHYSYPIIRFLIQCIPEFILKQIYKLR